MLIHPHATPKSIMHIIIIDQQCSWVECKAIARERLLQSASIM